MELTESSDAFTLYANSRVSVAAWLSGSALVSINEATVLG